MLSAPSLLELAHATHPGESGKNNEDHHLVMAFQASTGERVTLAVVADGIGGNRAGEVASALATQTIAEAVSASESHDFGAVLVQAAQAAARQVAERAQSPEFFGMGTTCAAVLIAEHRLYVAYAGDSRIYWMRGNSIRQISIDHTWIQEAVEYGVVKREEAKQHPHRHVVRRHLGGKPDVEIDTRLRLADEELPEQSRQNQGLRLQPGDGVLLCSDGLTDLVEAPEILNVAQQASTSDAVSILIDMARARGGHDNITVILLRVPPA
jgi:protein phosphatase